MRGDWTPASERRSMEYAVYVFYVRFFMRALQSAHKKFHPTKQRSDFENELALNVKNFGYVLAMLFLDRKNIARTYPVFSCKKKHCKNVSASRG